MGYAQSLQQTFPDLAPVVDDLFLLEAHEVAELLQRAPARELAAVLHAHPTLLRFLEVRHPATASALDRLLAAHSEVAGAELAACEAAIVWEVADLIVYQRAPEAYDRQVSLAWDPAAVTRKVDLSGARVIDAGAGTGRVALSIAPLAGEVYAVEPVAALRRYLRATAVDRGLDNVYVLDGFLHEIPLPPDSADVLLTCHAIGWDLPAELREIQRLVRPGGMALHAFDASMADPAGGPLGQELLAGGYQHEFFVGARGGLHCYSRSC